MTLPLSQETCNIMMNDFEGQHALIFLHNGFETCYQATHKINSCPRLPQCCKLHMYIQRLVCFLVVVPYYSHMVIRHTFLKNNIYLPKYIPSYDTNSQDPAQLQNTSTCSQNTLLYNVQNNTTRYVQIIHTIIHMENINSSFINLAPTYELWFVYIM